MADVARVVVSRSNGHPVVSVYDASGALVWDTQVVREFQSDGPDGVVVDLALSSAVVIDRGKRCRVDPVRWSPVSAEDASVEQMLYLVRLWRCFTHEDCWGGNHLSTADLRAQVASGHTEGCPCWRHKVLRAVDENLVGRV